MFASNTSQVSSDAVFVEDVFQNFLYTGNGSTQTITNGIDLSGKGGLVWIKKRNEIDNHFLFDTNRGATFRLISNATNASSDAGDSLVAFNSNGFNLDGGYTCNGSGNTLTSWTFRKQPKFFDVVTYTGTGSPVTVNHNLGSTPGCIIIKATSNTGNWHVWHRSVVDGSGYGYLVLNTTDATAGGKIINSTSSTDFVVASGLSDVGYTYVCYVFAHNAGGFGLTGTDNVISCGSFDGTANTDVTLGYEPQWIMFKNTTSASNWQIVDNMRGMFVGSADKQLMANLSNAESDNNLVSPTATGFTWIPSAAGNTYIYIAIRRGPMKVPTSGTSVFSPIAYAGNDVSNRIISGLINSPDLGLFTSRNAAGQANHITGSRLQGGGRYMLTESTSSESSSTAYGIQTYGQTSVTLGTAITNEQNALGINYILYAWQRAPSFFDEVCYTGDGTNGKAYNHNLTVVPTLVIVKGRSSTSNWKVLYQPDMRVLTLNTTAAYESAANTKYYFGNDTTDISPTATQFTVSNGGSLNVSGATYVAYLFATCAGVSKVGSYTGTGATLQINCGFTSGARFVLIKRTDSTGQWYVWDSARGIVAGNDPYLLLNTTDAEVTIRDWIDPYSAGFELSNDSGSDVNLNGCTFIYLAIA